MVTKSICRNNIGQSI